MALSLVQTPVKAERLPVPEEIPIEKKGNPDEDAFTKMIKRDIETAERGRKSALEEIEKIKAEFELAGLRIPMSAQDRINTLEDSAKFYESEIKRLRAKLGDSNPELRMWNDVPIYWLEQNMLFGKPIYDVKSGYWAKPVIRTTDREKAERFRDTENANIYLRSRIEDRRFLIDIAEKVGLKEDELEGFSNASVIGEITGSDDFKNIVRELAGNIYSPNPDGLTGLTLPGRKEPYYVYWIKTGENRYVGPYGKREWASRVALKGHEVVRRKRGWMPEETGNPDDRTPKQRFERLSIDNILKCVTSNRSIIPKLKILRERADEKGLKSEIQKIDEIIANLTDINDELLEIKSAVERRGEQTPVLPIGFRDESELDRRTSTKSLVEVTWGRLHPSRQLLERAKGTMRNLRARALEGKRVSESEDISRELERLTKIGMEIRNKQDAIRELALDDQSKNLGSFNNAFNGISREGYYLNFNKDEIFKALIASEGHFRNISGEDKAGFLNCVVKHLADAEGHCDEAISHALIAENEETSRSFLELRDTIRDFRRYIQSSPITREEGIREIRKIRRRFEGFNPDYDVSKCETCGDPSEVMEEINKILSEMKETPLAVAAHDHDDLLLIEREMAEKLIAKLSEKYGVEPPELEISDKCHEPQAGLYSAGKIMVCQTGVNLHVLAHEFWHHVQAKKGGHFDEGEAEKFAVELFEPPLQKGLYKFHNHSHNDSKMTKTLKDIGVIYGGQHAGQLLEMGLQWADLQRPEGIAGMKISLLGDIIGAIGGVAGALYLREPWDLMSALVGGHMSTDLWRFAAQALPAGLPLAVPPGLVYAPPTSPMTVRPPPAMTRGRYTVTG